MEFSGRIANPVLNRFLRSIPILWCIIMRANNNENEEILCPSTSINASIVITDLNYSAELQKQIRLPYVRIVKAPIPSVW